MFVLFCCVSSFPSVFSLCLLCVAGGVAGSLAAADEAHLLAIHLIIPSIKAWSSHHFNARLFRLLRTFVCLTTRLLILFSTRISKPASTLPLQPSPTSPTNKFCSVTSNNSFVSALGSKPSLNPNRIIWPKHGPRRRRRIQTGSFLPGKSCGAAREGLTQGYRGSHQPNLQRGADRRPDGTTIYSPHHADGSVSRSSSGSGSSSTTSTSCFARLVLHSAQGTLHPHACLVYWSVRVWETIYFSVQPHFRATALNLRYRQVADSFCHESPGGESRGLGCSPLT